MSKKKSLTKDDAEVIENLDMLLDMNSLQENNRWEDFIDLLINDLNKLEGDAA